MRKTQIKDCLRLYRKAVVAYGEMNDKLTQVSAASAGLPALRRTHQLLGEARGVLDRIGEGLSVVPELAGELLEEKGPLREMDGDDQDPL